MFGLLGFVGYKTRRLFEVVADISAFSLRTLRGTLDFHKQGFWTSFEVVVKQVYFTGLEAIPFLTLVSLILGSVVIIQSLPQLIGVGAQRFIGTTLVIAIIRELGPLITAVIVISRSGTAMAAELATNKVTGEIEALEAMGVDMFRFSVLPRIIGCIISTFCLIIYFDVIALVGGFLVASFKLTMPLTIYLGHIFDALTLTDVYISFSKGALFGMIVALFSCYNGLLAQRASWEVPAVARDGVMQAMFFVFVSSAIISVAFYL